jgi:hypothetical protein
MFLYIKYTVGVYIVVLLLLDRVDQAWLMNILKTDSVIKP